MSLQKPLKLLSNVVKYTKDRVNTTVAMHKRKNLEKQERHKKIEEHQRLVFEFREDPCFKNPNSLTELDVLMKKMISSLKVLYPAVAKEYEEMRRGIFYQGLDDNLNLIGFSDDEIRYEAVLNALFWLFKYRQYLLDGLEGKGIMAKSKISPEITEEIFKIVEYYYGEGLECWNGASILSLWTQYRIIELRVAENSDNFLIS